MSAGKDLHELVSRLKMYDALLQLQRSQQPSAERAEIDRMIEANRALIRAVMGTAQMPPPPPPVRVDRPPSVERPRKPRGNRSADAAQDTPARRRTTKRVFLVGALLSCVAAAIWLPGQLFPRHPPVFHQRAESPTLAELLATPAASPYGSEIDVWVFEGDGEHASRPRPVEGVCVTGHADSRTCRNVSASVLQALMQKFPEQGDFFVAGAAWLERHVDHEEFKRLKAHEDVLAYEKATTVHFRNQIGLSVAQSRALFEEGKLEEGKTELEKARAKVEESQRTLDQLQISVDVQKYLRHSRSENALTVLESEARLQADNSGLVRVHRIPAALKRAADECLQKAVETAAPTAFRLDTIAGEFEAVVPFPVTNLATRKPLVIRIDDSSLSPDEFAQACRQNLSDMERQMIGDAQRRKRAFDEKREEHIIKVSIATSWSEDELKKPVMIQDGMDERGRILQNGAVRQVTKKELRDRIYPQNERLLEKWLRRVEVVIRAFEEDRTLGDNSRVRYANYATLLDSMLRDWDLPVSASQHAFDAWRLAKRNKTWTQIRHQLDRMGIDANALASESTVFRIRLEKGTILVEPIHLIDLARSVVVIDPRVGVTRVVSPWERRIPHKQDREHNAVLAARMPRPVSCLIESLAAGDPSSVRAALLTALTECPIDAVRALEERRLGARNATTPNETQRSQLAVKRFWKRYGDVQQTARINDDRRPYYRAMWNLLRDYPEAPAHLHLTFAREIASEIAAEMDLDGAQKTEQWRVVELFAEYTSARLDGWYKQGFASSDIESPTAEWDIPGFRHKVLPDELANTQVRELYRRLQALRAVGEDSDVARLLEGVVARMQSPARDASFAPGFGDILEKAVLARYRLTAALGEDPADWIYKSVHQAASNDPAYFRAVSEGRGAGPALPERKGPFFESPKASLSMTDFSDLLAWEVREALEVNETMLAATSEVLRVRHNESNGLPPDASAFPLLKYLEEVEKKRVLGMAGLRLARDRTNDVLRSWRWLDRHELAALFASLADEALAVANMVSENEPVNLLLSATGTRLDARRLFEAGQYDKALSRIFSGKQPLAQLEAQISWTVLAGDWPGSADQVEVVREEGRLLVRARRHSTGEARDVLALSGPPKVELHEFADRLDAALSERGRGLVGDRDVSAQVLALPLPNPRDAVLIGLLKDKEVRIAFIKAMVYGGAPPAMELVSSQESERARTRRTTRTDCGRASGALVLDIPTPQELLQKETAALAR